MKIGVIYKLALTTMIVINGILIFLLIQGPPPPPHQLNNGGNDRMINRISLKLDLDDEQKKKLILMARVHSDSITKIDKEQKKLIKDYLSFLKITDEQIEIKDSLMNQIQSLEAAKIKFTYQHFEDLKNICKPDQVTRFEGLIDEVSGALLGEKHNGPPPHRP